MSLEPIAETAPLPSNTARPPRAIVRRWANWGLAAFLLAECAYGIWLGSDDNWNVVWWVTVIGVLVVNTLRRMPPVEQDARWWVWIVCTASTLRFLAFDYDDDSRTAFWLLIAFNLLADMALIALGKSFSLLPARRQIRTGWMYRLVRHPAYAAYMLTDFVYLSQMPTPRNAAVVLVGIGLFVCRARLEERLLANDPAYLEYMRRVRWRFLPGVY